MSDTPQGRFPKSMHLLKHSDFQRVYQQGQRHFSGNMTVFYLPAEAMSSEARSGGPRQARISLAGTVVRVGLTVPRSLGGAVERNRMRRRTREAVRHKLNLLNGMSTGVDVVINPKKGLLEAEFAQISSEVERAFQAVRRACEIGAKQSVANKSGARKPATRIRQEARPQ